MFTRLRDAVLGVDAPTMPLASTSIVDRRTASAADSITTRQLRGGVAHREGDGPAHTGVRSEFRPGFAGAEPPTSSPTRRGEPAWATRYLARLIATDLVVATAAIAVGILMAFSWSPAGLAAQWSLLPLAVLWPIAIAVHQGYDRSRFGVGQTEMGAIGKAAVSVIVLAALVDTFITQMTVTHVVVFAALAATLGGLVSRYLTRKLLHRRQAAGHDLRRLLLVGPAIAVHDLRDRLALESHHGLEVMGACVPAEDADLAASLGLPVVGDAADTALIARNLGCDTVAVTGGNPAGFLRRLAWSLEGDSVDLLVHPGLVEVAGPRMHIRQQVGLPLLHVEQPHFTGWRRVVKRTFDLLATGLGLLVISPVLAAIALAIKLGDGGPVFFRQVRVGIDGSTFTMIKFRTMVVDAEARKAALAADNEGSGLLFKMKHDPRITRVGRLLRAYSLDELPQLFNVMAGQMSLVGPRPPLPDEVAGYSSEVRRRLLVTPGLTGLWQVSGRSLLSWEESVRLDLRYVENWSLTMDLLLLWKTVWAVAAKRGAF